MEFVKAFRSLDISVGRYLAFYVAPTIAAGFILTVVALLFINPFLPGWLALILPFLILAFAGAVAFLYPVARADRRKSEINNAIPFFMTHLGVLSTSNLPRAEIFRLLGEKEEYGALAAEMTKIHRLVTQWNMALPQACRFVSLSTPSQILADFLDRLAQALETGQDLEAFLRNEQHVVMKEYATVYETAIYQIESLKEMYMSLTMSGVFLAIFALIAPIVTDISPAHLVMGVLILFGFIEFLALFLLKMRVPSDRLWNRLHVADGEKERIWLLTAAGVMIGLALFAVAMQLDAFPGQVNVAIGFTPLVAAGVYADVCERRLKRREDNYGAFIRSVGSSAGARGGSLREVLKKVRLHNFGALTSMVQNLFARLTWRINDLLAWRRFSAETGSSIVAGFNDMFVEGVKAGGRPESIGTIISDNVVRILSLRKNRYSTAGTFRGLLLGLTAGMAFTLFIGVGILDVLGSLFDLDAADNALNPIDVNFVADTGFIRNLLLLVIFAHAFVAAIMLKMVDGGSYIGGFLNFVIFMWIGVVLSLVSENVIRAVFNG